MRRLVVVLGLLVLLGIGFLVVGRYMGEREVAEDWTTEEVNGQDKLEAAKSVLEHLRLQRDHRGMYTDIGVCYSDASGERRWCELSDMSNRAGMSVIWARWKYFELTRDVTERVELQRDLVAYEKLLDGDEYMVQNDYYNCIFMDEVANNDILEERFKNIARRVCLESTNESFSEWDYSLEELRAMNSRKLDGILNIRRYDWDNDEIWQEFLGWSERTGWGVGLLGRYAYFAADEWVRKEFSGETERKYQELLTQALTFYLVALRDNERTQEEDCALATAIMMDDNWVTDKTKREVVDKLLKSTEKENILGDTCYLAHYKAGSEMGRWQMNEVNGLRQQNRELGAAEVGFFVRTVAADNELGMTQVTSDNISNAIRAGVLVYAK